MKINKKLISSLLLVSYIVCMHAADEDSGLQKYAQRLPWGSLLKYSAAPSASRVFLPNMDPNSVAKRWFQAGDGQQALELLEHTAGDPTQRRMTRVISLCNIAVIHALGSETTEQDLPAAVENFRLALAIPEGLHLGGMEKVEQWLKEIDERMRQEIDAPLVDIGEFIADDPEALHVLTTKQSYAASVNSRKRLERMSDVDMQNSQDNGTPGKKPRIASRHVCEACNTTFGRREWLTNHLQTKKHSEALSQVVLYRRS